MAYILEIADPLRNEAGRNLKIQRQTEEVLHLSREDGKCNTAGEAHDNRIRDEFKDDAHLAHTHHHKENTCHDCGDDQTLHSILADDSCNDHDECSGRTSDEEVGSAEE